MDKKEVVEVDFVKWFSELTNKDVSVAGGKGASLSEMYNNKFPIPPGFVVTAQAYEYFIEKTEIRKKINQLLDGLDVNETEKLNESSKKVREIIENTPFPKELEDAVIEGYDILDADKKNLDYAGSSGALGILKTSHEPPFVAVRSSATAEDLADASFAGQQESFLNVKGEKDLLKKVRQCFSSLFTPRAIYYREKKGFEHDKTYLAVVVQRMIDSDKSGVIFSRNPIKNDNSILIEAVWGLGEGIVSGRINPDNYIIDSDLDNFNISKIKVSEKKVAIVRDSAGKNKVVTLTPEKSKHQVLTNYEIKRLAQYAKQLEEHYGKPQDIEFAIEGEEIYIVQSRPITTKASDELAPEISGEVLTSGLGASPGVGSGVVKVIKDLSELDKVKPGDILVTTMTNPDMVVSMQKAAGIVTDEGGVTSHAAIVSREMGIPAVVGTGNATSVLHDGEVITVDGNTGKVFQGRGETKVAEIKPVVPTKTKIKVIVDIPDYASRAAQSGAKGVGLVRLEGIIASSGKHPLKYVKEDKIKDYIAVLNEGLKRIAEPFEEIWVRSSDIRSDEFRNLEGASKEVEGNPMLGNHGIRFSLRHPEILKAELTAIKEVADDYPQKKIGLMMPQIISVSELAETKRIAREEVHIPKNVRIGIMVETPAAVEIIKDLCEEGTDFISFGTNDLTQYTLAVDRNNGDVQYLYDEMHPAVLNSIKYVIRTCKRYGVETSICGQAGSKEEMVRFLLKEGINSISVNADAAHDISSLVADLEKSSDAERSYSSSQMNSTPQTTTAPPTVDRPQKQFENDNLEGEKAVQQNTVSMDQDIDVDIEEAVLKELGDEKMEDYLPGDGSEKKDIPPLNDAIPVDSSAFDEMKEKKIDEIILEPNIGEGHKEEVNPVEMKEWTGEDRKLDIF